MDCVVIFSACVSTWTVNNNIYSNGMYSIGAKTLTQCKERCVMNPNCVAIDHNYKDGNCWISEKKSDLVNQYRWTDGNQYILVNKCDTPPTDRELFIVLFLVFCSESLDQSVSMIHVNYTMHSYSTQHAEKEVICIHITNSNEWVSVFHSYWNGRYWSANAIHFQLTVSYSLFLCSVVRA